MLIKMNLTEHFNSPVRFYLVHFRSMELAETLHFGRFWHAFPVGTGFLIDQDEKDTFTVHYPLQEGVSEVLDPHEVVHKMLGGCLGKWSIRIDEVLASSEWQPSFGIVERYSTETGRVHLSGDAGILPLLIAFFNFSCGLEKF
jgi:hypothetical protein